MNKYKFNDRFYTVIGVLVVIVGVVIFLLTSGVFDKNEEKLENNDENTSGEINNSPTINDETTPSTDNTTPDEENDAVEDESTTSDKNTNSNDDTTNNQGNANQSTTPVADTLSCTMTSEENGVKIVNVCDNVFKNGYLSTQTCVGTMTSSDKTVLDQQYQLTKYLAEAFDASIGDASAIKSTVTYENGKIIYTQFADAKKVEDAIKKYNESSTDGSTITYDISSKDTKEDVRKKQVAEGYSCK